MNLTHTGFPYEVFFLLFINVSLSLTPLFDRGFGLELHCQR